MPIDEPDKTARDIADSITIEGWDELMDDLKDITGQISQASGEDVLGVLGFQAGDAAFEHVAESTLEEAAARAADLVGKRILANGRIIDNPNPAFAITESTRDMIYETINDALEAGLSAGALRDQIVDSYAFSNARALNIARTERSFAQNRGALVAAKTAGVVKGKRWVIASEHDQDDECDLNANDGVIELTSDFSSGDPAPPAHPNCSCTIEFTTESPAGEEEEATYES